MIEHEEEGEDIDDFHNDEELVKIVTGGEQEYENQRDPITRKKSISVLDDDIPTIDTNILTSVLLKEPPRWKQWFSKKSNSTPNQNDKFEKVDNRSGLVTKFVKCMESTLSSGSFYFSYDIDLTNILTITPDLYPFNDIKNDFYYNKHLTGVFEGTCLVLPIIQGYIGHCMIPLNMEEMNDPNISEKGTNQESESIPQIIGDLFLISRRSVKRAGVRYLRRGIDDNANCANWVETEQLIQLPASGEVASCSFTQVRGSIPVYFSQSPYKLQPIPKLLKEKHEMTDVFVRHFHRLQHKYGETVGISLVEKSPSRESTVGEMYQQLAEENNIYLEWFDFHRVCKGLQFNQVDTLFDTGIGKKLVQFGWTDSHKSTKQSGVFRINCIDCLDRTNVVQTSIGKRVLLNVVSDYNFNFDDWKLFEMEFNNIWANNGDAISQQYSSTNALKGDFTRTSQRNYKGVLNDAFLTLSRYFYGMVSDFFMQAAIDYALGNVGEEVFDDFEENMESRDSSVNLGSVRSSAIEAASSIVLASDHEIVYGGWWLLTPREGDIRRAELKDTVILVTDSAVYICDFDLKAEKVVDFHRIPSKSVSVIQTGCFYGEILSQASKNPLRNRGILLKYNLDGVTSASDLSISTSQTTPKSISPDISQPTTPPPSKQSFIAIKIPTTQIDDFDLILASLQQCCPNADVIEQDIVSLEEATSNTGIWDTLEYYMKRAVWA